MNGPPDTPAPPGEAADVRRAVTPADLRVRHLVGLGLVAVLTVGSAWAAGRVSDTQRGGARLINAAGRQRMLSQNIAATALAATCQPGEADPTERQIAERDELDRLLSVFDAGHAEVLDLFAAFANGPADERAAAALDLKKSTFGESVAAFRRGLAAGGVGPEEAEDLRWESRDFLALMDRFVSRCEARVDGRVAASRRPQLAAVAAALLSILAVYLLVSLPTERQVAGHIATLGRQREELEVALERAAAAGRAKTEFLANMSHELRTPLQSVLGYADVAAAAAAEGRAEDAGAAWAVVRRSGRHLLRLINNVLDLAKVEAGHVDLETFPVAPQPLVRELIATLRPQVAEGVAMGAAVDADVPPALLTDPTRLRQILLNLLGNAVKFTAGGEIRITVRREASGRVGPDGRPLWEFVVTDTGCGVPRGDLERLFRPFEQADASTTRAYGGTGLGLAVSRRLADRLGGELIAESAPGRGSTFTLRLPAAPAAAPEEEREERPAAAVDGPKPLEGLRVLLAEDTEDNRRLLSFYLNKDGAAVEAVADGRQAVDRLLGAAGSGGSDGPPFDVVLMDMQMPVLDGYDAVREMRARGYGGPVVALTAHAMAGDADVCRAAGCDGYAVKPINREELAAAVLAAVAAPVAV